MEIHFIAVIALITGFILDITLGDPMWLPHPIVGFGKLIGWCEKKLNQGTNQTAKGAIMTIALVGSIFVLSYYILAFSAHLYISLNLILSSFAVFYCLSGLTLRREVSLVFDALKESLYKGRKQLARIVGRDTKNLTATQIKTAALETLAENLSDGVIAPLFWFAVLGVPGMLSYKMINTLDSMIGYKNDRYLHFGKFAARLDDVANFIPARLTALLMLIVSGQPGKLKFVLDNGNKHASPNSGYPEAALAGILDCRFGGPNLYFGQLIAKPYIGSTERRITENDLKKSLSVNKRCEVSMLILICIILLIPVLF